MRLDQWLWAVRVFKSRSLAAEAIRGGRVEVDGAPSKPAHEARIGEVITVHFRERERCVTVRGFPPSRVGAKLVAQFVEAEAPHPSLSS